MGYMSIADCMIANGDRHLTNAIRHAANGELSYAWGSYQKAKRNWIKARDFKVAMNPRTYLLEALRKTDAH